MKKQGTKYKKTAISRSGAASIYVVVVAALLFSIITVSFIRILLRNASNSAANEMAQMAYDSALAGVEDAKTAISIYRSCQKDGKNRNPTGDKCEKIMEAIERSYDYAKDAAGATEDALKNACDSVRHAIAGDLTDSSSGETLIQQTSANGSATNQAYTCVLLAEDLKDYRSTLSESTPMRVIPLRPKPASYDNAGRNAAAYEVGYIRIDWYSKDNNSGNDTLSFGQNGISGTDSVFQPLDGARSKAKPSILSAQLIQTKEEFSLEEFKNSSGTNSNRSLAYLVPKDGGSLVSGATEISSTIITANELAQTNDHNNYPKNGPFEASCVGTFADGNGFACSKVLELPGTYLDNASRNWETFYLVLNLPYRVPETDFSVRMYKKDSGCDVSAKKGEDDACLLEFSGVQVAVDSTGRANDLFSRVEARIEFTDLSFPFPQYALQATSGDDDAINKNFYITQDCIKTKRNAAGQLEVESCTNSGPAD